VAFLRHNVFGPLCENNVIHNKYQLLLTNARDALHHGKRAANKGGCSVW